MPKRNFSTIEEFRANLHKEGATLVDFNGSKVPCILIDPRTYEQILASVQGKKLAVDSTLDIFYDGRDVFVDVQLKFLNTGFEANYLFYANEMHQFFESLAESGLIALAPDTSTGSTLSSQDIFMIQLPKKDAAVQALDIIKKNARVVSQDDPASNKSRQEHPSSSHPAKQIPNAHRAVTNGDPIVPPEIDTHYQLYGKHAWEVTYGERCTTCGKRIDEYGLCACGSAGQ